MRSWLNRASTALVIVLAACDAANPTGPETVAQVVVSPPASELAAGTTVQLTAQALGSSGRAVEGTPAWSSSDSSVARVSAQGVVTAVRQGAATIRAEVAGRSGAASVQVTTNPVPQLAQLSPATVAAGSASLSVQLHGSAFVAGAVVLWNGVPRATTFISDRVLRIDLRAAELIETGTAQVLVQNPAQAAGSAALQFVVQRPAGPLLRVDRDTVHITIGDTARVRAVVYDAAGERVRGGTVTWSRLDNGTDFSPYGSWSSPRDSIRLRGREIGTALLEVSSAGMKDTVVVRISPVTARIATVSAGAGISCGLDSAQRAHCWGRTWPYVGTWAPMPVQSATSFRSIDTGHSHACALDDTGRAWCWYSGNDGALGSGTFQDTETPVLAAGGRTFTSLVTGGWHSCGLTPAGELWCWGANPYGQLGDGTQQRRPAAVQVAPGLNFRQVAAGGYHTCALTADGRLWCWGYNSHGQAGPQSGDCIDPLYGTSLCSTRPVEMATGLRFAQVTAGGRHTCALTAAGLTYCWGDGARGQLGNGARDSAREPVQAAAGRVFVSIEAGFGNTCGLTAAGGAWCWGQNDFGNNGVPPVGSEVCIENNTGYACNPSAVPVSGGHTFASLSVGWYHSCAVTTTATPYCWGDNGTGEVGAGRYDDWHYATPQRVADGGAMTLPGRVGAVAAGKMSVPMTVWYPK